MELTEFAGIQMYRIKYLPDNVILCKCGDKGYLFNLDDGSYIEAKWDAFVPSIDDIKWKFEE